MIRSKLLQFVSGANVLTFWLTAYLWDMFTFLITVILMIITFGIFQEDGWSTGVELSRVLLILFAFIFAILPVTFFASRFFQESADGFSILSLIYIVTGETDERNSFRKHSTKCCSVFQELLATSSCSSCQWRNTIWKMWLKH